MEDDDVWGDEECDLQIAQRDFERTVERHQDVRPGCQAFWCHALVPRRAKQRIAGCRVRIALHPWGLYCMQIVFMCG